MYWMLCLYNHLSQLEAEDNSAVEEDLGAGSVDHAVEAGTATAGVGGGEEPDIETTTNLHSRYKQL